MKQIIYVVEDNRMMREFLVNILSADYELYVFDSGQKLLHSMESHMVPDLVMLDYGLEGSNGHEVLSKIRSNQEFDLIPVVFLSGEQKSDVKIKCLKDGADDFISKPFNPVELKIRIDKSLASVRKFSPLKAS
ncbi:response regulator [Ekhidna sp.]|uniref:response regulator n=1 Tax=Ekhidna sp. TaxID=2608089 RepID=UPI003CCB9320